MFEIILTLILCFFSAVGIEHIPEKVLGSFHKKTDYIVTPHIVFPVKNQEESIEAFVRSLIWKYRGLCREDMPLYIIDLGCEDETPFIIKTLQKEYDFLHFCSKNEYFDVINAPL